MSQAIETYLDRVMAYANIHDADEAAARRAEQADHLNEKIERLAAEGMAREDAIFAAIEEHGTPAVVGYGLRHWRWVDIRTKGTARGVVAIGPKAVGVVACGGVSVGVVSFGGVSVGVLSIGGVVLSLLMCWGGIGLSLGAAYCGMAIGTLAVGGVAVGLVAMGGLGIGLLAEGGQQITAYTTETAPPALNRLQELVPDFTAFPTINIALGVLFGLLMTAMLYGEWREKKRLGRIDPRLLAE